MNASTLFITGNERKGRLFNHLHGHHSQSCTIHGNGNSVCNNKTHSSIPKTHFALIASNLDADTVNSCCH